MPQKRNRSRTGRLGINRQFSSILRNIVNTEHFVGDCAQDAIEGVSNGQGGAYQCTIGTIVDISYTLDNLPGVDKEANTRARVKKALVTIYGITDSSRRIWLFDFIVTAGDTPVLVGFEPNQGVFSIDESIGAWAATWANQGIKYQGEELPDGPSEPRYISDTIEDLAFSFSAGEGTLSVGEEGHKTWFLNNKTWDVTSNFLSYQNKLQKETPIAGGFLNYYIGALTRFHDHVLHSNIASWISLEVWYDLVSEDSKLL